MQYSELGRDVIDLVNNYDVEDIFDDDKILAYVEKHFSSEEVFEKSVLIDWAQKNLYPEDLK